MRSPIGGSSLRRRTLLSLGAIGGLGLAVVLVLSLTTSGGSSAPRSAATNGRLLADPCGGPTGTAFVADAGYDAFSQVNTANCAVVQNGGYNVGDTQVPGDAGDYNYSSTDEGIIATRGNLWFADTGTSNVAVINIASLDPSNYNPAEKLINTGLNPQALAATADGTEVWVADTGPQTSPRSPSGIDVISTSTDSVTATIPLAGQPSDIAFSPNGSRAYVTTSNGLAVFNVAAKTLVAWVRGLDQAHGVAVSPDGAIVYVTNAGNDTVSVINSSTGRITGTIAVGSLPWQVLFAPSGESAYVTDADSNQISVIDVSASKVSSTIPVPDDPDALAFTSDPSASELWVGENAGGTIGVIDTATNTLVSTISLGTAYEPTGIAIVG